MTRAQRKALRRIRIEAYNAQRQAEEKKQQEKRRQQEARQWWESLPMVTFPHLTNEKQS